MKKTLIALAAVAVSTGAMAQATISGNLNIGAVGTSKTTTQAGGQTASATSKTSSTAAANQWGASVITFSGTEDLGGGLKASFVIVSGIGAGAADSGMGQRERTLALSGGFGTVRMGRFVPAAAVGFHGFSGAGSATLSGSIYGLATGGSATAPNPIHASGVANTNMERQENAIQYTSPNFNGFTVNVNYGQTKTDTSALPGSVKRDQTGIHVGYSAGPLSVGAATNTGKAGTEADVTDFLPANSTGKARLDWIGASYNFGVATLFATHAKRKDQATIAGVTTTETDIKLNAIGVAVPVGAITLRASTYSGKDKRGTGNQDNMKLAGHQVSATYALSKRTSVIAAMGKNEIKRDGAAALATPAGKVQANTLTLNHNF
jgi:predicted porin